MVGKYITHAGIENPPPPKKKKLTHKPEDTIWETLALTF
jgi:hypothetical protein